MARVIVKPQLKTWDDVAARMVELKAVAQRIMDATARRDQAIEDAKVLYKEETKADIKARTAMKQEIGDFAAAHEDDMTGRTIELPIGSISISQRTRVALLDGWTWAKVVEKLVALKLFDFIKTTYKEKRLQIRQSDLDAKALARFGCERETYDSARIVIPGVDLGDKDDDEE